MKGRGKRLEHQLARALWEEAREAGMEEGVVAELDRLGAALRREPRLRQVLLHPAVQPERKAELVRYALSLSAPVVSLARAMVAFRSPGLLAGVRRAYQGFLAAGAHEVTVHVASASPLSAAERRVLADSMSAALRKPVHISVRTRRDLLGGLLVRVGERIVDGTLKGAYDRLERELTSPSVQSASSGGWKVSAAKGRK